MRSRILCEWRFAEPRCHVRLWKVEKMQCFCVACTCSLHVWFLSFPFRRGHLLCVLHYSVYAFERCMLLLLFVDQL